MIHDYILPVMFFIVLVLILIKKDNKPSMSERYNYTLLLHDEEKLNTSNSIKEYNRGYIKAMESIASGANVDELLFQAETSLTNDQFDKGWKQACEIHIKQQKNILVSNRAGK